MDVYAIMRAASDMMFKLLNDNAPDIHSAYLKAEGPLAVNLAMKLTPKAAKETLVETTINFVKTRVKRTLEKTVYDLQPELFPGTRVTFEMREGSDGKGVGECAESAKPEAEAAAGSGPQTDGPAVS